MPYSQLKFEFCAFGKREKPILLFIIFSFTVELRKKAKRDKLAAKKAKKEAKKAKKAAKKGKGKGGKGGKDDLKPKVIRTYEDAEKA